MRRQLVILVSLVLLLVGAASPVCAAWSFGIMGDTQWKKDDGKNPNSVAVDIINQVNEAMIARGVKFVIAVGDITDNGSKVALDTRATYAQALYNAGIGFYPLRGNHEATTAAAAEFRRIFPQTRDGLNNATPGDAIVTTPDDAQTHPVAKSGSAFAVGTAFSSPRKALDGLSYSFDYRNARFVLLDQFSPLGGGSNSIKSQQAWINDRLADRRVGTHAFVLTHKGIITENHPDTLFGKDPSAEAPAQDAFIASLRSSGVRYLIGGHDHMHNRALVTTTEGESARIQELIAASESYKFYTPAKPDNDTRYNVPAFGRKRETPISQELYHIGYYICTVDGPRVTVDYYAVPSAQTDGDLVTTPPLTGKWRKRESFGYSLNGRQFVVAQGQSYTCVRDRSPTTAGYVGTVARILHGKNRSKASDYAGRPLTKVITTGWTGRRTLEGRARSDALTIWGMETCADATGDTYVLSMSIASAGVPLEKILSGSLAVLTRSANGNWVDAASSNSVSRRKFVLGPYTPDSGYTLGTCGVDPLDRTAWVVLNHDGQFVVAERP